MIELDNTMLLFIGSENYSGKKIPWAAMPVRVQVPSEARKNIVPLTAMQCFSRLTGSCPLQ